MRGNVQAYVIKEIVGREAENLAAVQPKPSGLGRSGLMQTIADSRAAIEFWFCRSHFAKISDAGAV